MADGYRRGEPRRVRRGDYVQHDASDVLRDVLHELVEQRAGGSQAAFADEIRVNQPTLNRFMNDEVDGKVGLITKVCLATGETPASLFGRHKLYRHLDEANASKARITSLFSSILQTGEASSLLAVVDDAKSLGVLDQAITAARAIVDAARFSDKPPRRPRRAPRKRA